MAKFKIVGLPRAKKGLEVITADPESRSVVEAEKGETVLTKDVSSNQKQLVAIGGKKHYDGGTKLDLPEGSIIYSDHLKIKDPTILKFFNESGKKAKTFAEISKKFDITALNKERHQKTNDAITNKSLDKSIEDANFKLSALFAFQEFHEDKEVPAEHSKQFEPFLDRMGLTYEDLFGTKGAPEPEMQSPTQFGGQVRFDPVPGQPMPRAKVGAQVNVTPPYDESQAFKKQGIIRLNKYLKEYGLPEIEVKDYPHNSIAVLNKIEQVQNAVVKKNPTLVFDYMTTGTEDNQKSHKPNAELQGIMRNVKNSAVKPSGPNNTYTNEDVQKMLTEGTLKTEDILNGYEDKKWWYRMVDDEVKTVSKQEMDALRPQLEKEGIKQGDLTYLHMGDGLYRAYKMNDDEVVEVEADPAVVDELYKWNIKPMEAPTTNERNMDFLWSNKRSLQQAKRNRNRIPYLRPMTAVGDTFYTDSAYYNPDQAINAISSMVGVQGEKQAMFAPQQQQTANFLASQQFDLMGQVISQYADQNVDAYNKERLMNTQIAQGAADRLSAAIQGQHDKTTLLKQEYANAREKANNIVAQNEIAMWQERADRLNLEATIGEQYAKDPTTGIHQFVKGKDFYPDKPDTTSVADTFNNLKSQMVGVSDDVVAKIALGMHSGKYELQETGLPPNAQDFNT